MKLQKINKLLGVCLILLIAGCGVDIDPKSMQHEWAQHVCDLNGGLKNLRVYDYITPTAECNNGAVFNSLTKDLKEFIDANK